MGVEVVIFNHGGGIARRSLAPAGRGRWLNCGHSPQRPSAGLWSPPDATWVTLREISCLSSAVPKGHACSAWEQALHAGWALQSPRWCMGLSLHGGFSLSTIAAWLTDTVESASQIPLFAQIKTDATRHNREKCLPRKCTCVDGETGESDRLLNKLGTSLKGKGPRVQPNTKEKSWLRKWRQWRDEGRDCSYNSERWTNLTSSRPNCI